MNILELRAQKSAGRKLTMVTCYDYWSAALLSETGIDMLLVGDSAAMVMHGFNDTLPATIDMLVPHVQAVKRGAGKKFIVADLPFLAFRADLKTNIENVCRLMQAGAQAVKLEGYDRANHDLVRHLTDSGVPVMGHLGLTPQFVNAFGGFKVQGRASEQKKHILEQARGLEAAGCFSLVLECVPSDLSREISSAIKIPTIGIGAGPNCDGQVLVLHDLLGLNEKFKPKFVRQFLDGAKLIREAVESYRVDVQEARFPRMEESYE